MYSRARATFLEVAYGLLKVERCVDCERPTDWNLRLRYVYRLQLIYAAILLDIYV